MSPDEDAGAGFESDSVIVRVFHSMRQCGKALWTSSTAHAKLRYLSALRGEGSNEVSTFWGGIAPSAVPVSMFWSSLSLISFTSSFMMSNISSAVSLALSRNSVVICGGGCCLKLWMVEVAPFGSVVVVVVWSLGVGNASLFEDLSSCVLAAWVGSVVISVGWSALDALVFGSVLPSSVRCSVPSGTAPRARSRLSTLWSSSIGSGSVVLSPVCAGVGVFVGVVGTVIGFDSKGVSVGGVSGVGRGGCGCGFLSVRRIL